MHRAILLAILLILIILSGVYFIQNQKLHLFSENNQVPLPTLTIQPTLTPVLDEEDGSNLSDACGAVGKAILHTTYVDLGNNALTTLDTSLIDPATVKEVSLVGNSFSWEEQRRIEQQFPDIKMHFFPQTYQLSARDGSWKKYTSRKANISFSHPVELEIFELTGVQGDRIEIRNTFASFPYAWRSCALEESYIYLTLSWGDKEDARSMEQYLSDTWEVPFTKEGKKYVVPEDIGMRSMIGNAQEFTAGNIKGVHIRVGEATHEQYIAKINNRYYHFTMRVGGQTGSVIGKFPKELMLGIIGSLEEID